MWFRKLAREPLLHFLLIGAGLFVLFDAMNGPATDPPNRIVVSAGQVEQLAERFSQTWMRPPSEQEMTALIDGHLRDEVYYREAVALGLDQDDRVIRRRLRQKLEFIFEDVAALQEPTDAELTAFMHEHREQFLRPPQLSFRQVYLSYDQRPDLNADAKEILARLRAGEDPERLGDRIMLADEFPLVSQTDIERRFGDEFARQLVVVPPGVWTGPLMSGFGGHLVRVSARVEGRMPELAEVREKVQGDWELARRNELKEATFRKLLENYEVVLEEPQASAGTVLAASPPAAETR
jgi:hypothetical protein